MAADKLSGDEDVIGAIQSHLKSHSKCIADTLWGIQQLKSQADEPTISKLAMQLNSSAATLDRLIDALPDYDMDIDAVALRIEAHSKRYADRAAAVSAVTEALAEARAELADKIIRTTAEETGVLVPPKSIMLAGITPASEENGGEAKAAGSR